MSLEIIGADKMPSVVWGVLLAAMLLSSCFSKPERNMVKRLLLGLGSSMLPLLSTFSDTLSYLRLFAVGLASYHIASALIDVLSTTCLLTQKINLCISDL